MKNPLLLVLLFFASCRYFKSGDEFKIIRADIQQTRARLEQRIAQSSLLAEKEINAASPFLSNIKKANEQRIQLIDFMNQLIEAGDKSGTTQMDFDWKMLAREMLNYNTQLKELVRDSLHTETLSANADSLGKTHFAGKTGEEIALYLSKIAMDVLLLNEEAVTLLRIKAKNNFYPVDSLEMRVLAKSSSVKMGQEFRAEILFAAHNTGEDRMFRVSQEFDSLNNDLKGEIDTVYCDDDNDYRFHYSFKPKKAGEQVVYFMATHKLAGGAQRKFPVRVKFKVTK